MVDFNLPELGENVTAGDVLRVLVKPGDMLAKDQTVLELETDKATIEVPSSVAGQVKDVKVKAGDKVKVGQTILSVEDDASRPSAGPGRPEPIEGGKAQGIPIESRDRTRASVTPQKAAAEPPGKAPAGPAGSDAQRQSSTAAGATPRTAEPDEPAEELPIEGRKHAGSADKQGGTDKVVDINRGARQASGPSVASELPVAPAAPSVRRMARELGVNVDQVAGSGPDGRISIEDVKAHAKRLVTGSAAAAGGAAAAEPLPDFSRWGEVARQPMRAVRRKTAEHLSAAWATIPHVTQHDLADVTVLEEVRKRYAKQAEAAGGNLTVTAIAVKVAAAAMKVFPQFNSSIDLATEEIIYKKYMNIGVAVDTDRGLLVPVVRGADTKNIIQLSVDLAQLSEKARTRKISLDEMQGGCFSISNLGGIGGSFFTPIINAPEVAILGISRARMEPIHDRETGQFAPRLMLPLSLSYDHRVIDGADGARFLRWIVEAFEQPFLLALQG
jgi:pyruvate dehydrogenase E2 component (dihydrolipoamide acetyltransferase)